MSTIEDKNGPGAPESFCSRLDRISSEAIEWFDVRILDASKSALRKRGVDNHSMFIIRTPDSYSVFISQLNLDSFLSP